MIVGSIGASKFENDILVNTTLETLLTDQSATESVCVEAWDILFKYDTNFISLEKKELTIRRTIYNNNSFCIESEMAVKTLFKHLQSGIINITTINLIGLEFSNEALATLGSCLGSLQYLNTVNCHKPIFKGPQLHQFLSELDHKKKKITFLKFSGTELTQDFINDLGQFCELNHTLTRLELYEPNKGNTCLEKLLGSFVGNKKFRLLELHKVPLNDKEIAALATSVSTLQNLVEIGLCNIDLDDSRMQTLLDGLETQRVLYPASNVVLNIQQNPKISSQIAEKIVSAETNIHTLYLTKTGANSVSVIISALEHRNHKLTDIVFTDLDLSTENLAQLFNFIDALEEDKNQNELIIHSEINSKYNEAFLNQLREKLGKVNVTLPKDDDSELEFAVQDDYSSPLFEPQKPTQTVANGNNSTDKDIPDYVMECLRAYGLTPINYPKSWEALFLLLIEKTFTFDQSRFPSGYPEGNKLITSQFALHLRELAAQRLKNKILDMTEEDAIELKKPNTPFENNLIPEVVQVLSELLGSNIALRVYEYNKGKITCTFHTSGNKFQNQHKIQLFTHGNWSVVAEIESTKLPIEILSQQVEQRLKQCLKDVLSIEHPEFRENTFSKFLKLTNLKPQKKIEGPESFFYAIFQDGTKTDEQILNIVKKLKKLISDHVVNHSQNYRQFTPDANIKENCITPLTLQATVDTLTMLSKSKRAYWIHLYCIEAFQNTADIVVKDGFISVPDSYIYKPQENPQGEPLHVYMYSKNSTEFQRMLKPISKKAKKPYQYQSAKAKMLPSNLAVQEIIKAKWNSEDDSEAAYFPIFLDDVNSQGGQTTEKKRNGSDLNPYRNTRRKVDPSEA